MYVGITLSDCPHRTRVEVLQDLQKEVLIKMAPYGRGVVQAVMPCGHRAVFASVAELPTADIRCTCGDPEHWFVKWHEAAVPKANIWRGPLYLSLMAFITVNLCFVIYPIKTPLAPVYAAVGCNVFFFMLTGALWWERRRK